MREFTLYARFFIVLILTACGNENGSSGEEERPGTTGEDPLIVFEARVNDLGAVREGEKVVSWFDYTNQGNGQLVINDIKAGCGCTVPKWDKKPLAPGDSGSVKVIFDSNGKKGMQQISITVSSNAENAREKLTLKAQVKI